MNARNKSGREVWERTTVHLHMKRMTTDAQHTSWWTLESACAQQCAHLYHVWSWQAASVILTRERRSRLVPSEGRI